MVMLTEEDLKRLEWKAPDYAVMSEEDFIRLLNKISVECGFVDLLVIKP